MLKIGITGGIGSGKSTVARVFEELGIPVYYADQAARRIMEEHEALKLSIQQHFGTESYQNGRLNREYLSSRVFNNPEELQLLNNLVHPVTIADAENWMNRQNSPYTLKEAALIFESGGQIHLDKVIGVYAPQALRIRRVIERDGNSRDQILQKMEKQLNERIKMRLCDYVITNDDHQLIIPQVLQLHEHFLHLADEKKRAG